MTGTARIAALDRTPGQGEDLVLTVTVTEAHIRLGKPGVCWDCPVALAIIDACKRFRIDLEDGFAVKVYGDHVDVTLADGRWYSGTLPYDARRFVANFDHGPEGAVTPFAFPLALSQYGDTREV